MKLRAILPQETNGFLCYKDVYLFLKFTINQFKQRALLTKFNFAIIVPIGRIYTVGGF